MRHPLALSLSAFLVAWPLLFAAAETLPASLESNQCFLCHQEIDTEPLWSDGDLAADLHLARGILCEHCHGGDPAADDPVESMDPEKGFVGTPSAADVPGFCGRCHSDAAYMARFDPALPVDQVRKYFTSRHGERLAQGDAKVAECVSCHGAHGMVEVRNTTSPVYDLNIIETCAACHADPNYMAEYGIPTDQYEEYARSVHGVALLEHADTSSPACNDCHGNHGAVPPGAPSVANICSVCHARTSELFGFSPHKPAFDARDWPECSQCHGDHGVRQPDDSMLGVSPPAVCVACHKTPDDPGYAVAATMKERIVALADGMEQARAQFEHARNLGMEVAEIELLLRDVRQHLIQSRALVHTVDIGQVTAETRAGFDVVRRARGLAEAAVSEYYFRRKGLGISTLIITFVVVMLYLKIRQIESRRR